MKQMNKKEMVFKNQAFCQGLRPAVTVQTVQVHHVRAEKEALSSAKDCPPNLIS